MPDAEQHPPAPNSDRAPDTNPAVGSSSARSLNDPEPFPPARGESLPDKPLLVLQMKTPATIVLTFVNLAVFAAMLVKSGLRLEPSIDMLLRWGANFGPLTATTEPWRMVTSMFLHAGLLHIAFNMYALWQLGQLVERFYGTRRFVILYFLTGLAGSCASLMFHPTVVGVGASGAIFGVLGALLSYATVERMSGGDPRFKRMQSSVFNCIALNLVLGFTIPNIDNSAHLGGLAFGILAGFVIAPIPIPGVALKIKSREIFGTVLLVLVLAGLVPLARYTAGKNDQKVEQYNSYIHELQPLLKAQDKMLEELKSAGNQTPALSDAEYLTLVTEWKKSADEAVLEFQKIAQPSSEFEPLHQHMKDRTVAFAMALGELQEYLDSHDPERMARYQQQLAAMSSALNDFLAAKQAYFEKYGLKSK